MSLEYVRKHYGVPAKRGTLVTYRGFPYRITSATHDLALRATCTSSRYLHCSAVNGRRRIRVHPEDPDLIYGVPPAAPQRPLGECAEEVSP
jgi:hypothetical protein